MKLLWHGYCYGSSGYAAAGRGMVLALRNLGVRIQLKPVYPFHRQSRVTTEHIHDLRRLERPFSSAAPIAIHHTVPDKFQKLADWNVGVTYWETTRVPKQWVNMCNSMDHLVLFSEVNRAAFQDSGVTIPIDVVPPGVDTFPTEEVLESPNLSKDAFIFFSMSEWVPRKGFDLLIRAYLEEFSKKDDVILLIKTKLRKQTPQILKDVENLKMSVHRLDKPNIIVHAAPLSREQLNLLYRLSDAYVLASRGEGVGLTYLEAGSMGLPVIATGWGGQTGYLNAQNSFLVDYRMVAAHKSQECPWYGPDQLWAEPDVNHLRHTLRYVYDNRDEAGQKAHLLQSQIAANHSWDYVATQFKRVLLERWQGRRRR